MRWASVISHKSSTAAEAVAECRQALHQALPGSIDLALIFAHPGLGPDYIKLGQRVQESLGAKVVLGCSAWGIMGGNEELEEIPALSILAAQLPQVQIQTFHLEQKDLPDLDAPPTAWHAALGVDGAAQFVILADGASITLEQLLGGLDFAYPFSPKIGGQSSGQRSVLWLNGRVHTRGVVGIALQGNIVLDTIVAQGCRPIGQPLRITDCQQYMLLGLENRTPLHLLQEIMRACSEEERDLVRSNALFIGLLADEFKSKPQHGDFLIRNLAGVDPRTGSLAIGQNLRMGQTMQFHVKDRNTSREDLLILLKNYIDQAGASTVEGILLFSCLGRGQYFYGVPNHDTACIQSQLGALPLGGFFCNGEIGPLGRTTYLHGYTSVIGLFRPLYNPSK